MARTDTLTPRQRRFTTAMLNAPSVDKAATAAGVSLRTAWRWLKLPIVKAALSEALDAALADVTRQTVAAMGEAVRTLSAVHQDREQPAGARVSAARAILTGGPALREAFDLAQRVGELERLQNEHTEKAG